MQLAREEALRLLQANHTAAEAAQQLGVSLRTIQRWAAEFKAEGHVLPRKRGGQTKLSPDREADAIAAMTDGPGANGLNVDDPWRWRLYDAANFLYRNYGVYYAPNHLRPWLEQRGVRTLKDGSEPPPLDPATLDPLPLD